MDTQIQDIINNAIKQATKELNDEIIKLKEEKTRKQRAIETKPRKQRAKETKPRITRVSKYEGKDTAERRKEIKKEHYKTKGKLKYAKISRSKRHDINMEEFNECNNIIELNEKVVSILKDRGYSDKLIIQVVRTRNIEYKPYKVKTDDNLGNKDIKV
tara:strand:- start:5053 stop:5526 length:474 start_codon:yes stop_codon:yes gene_type:complete